MKKLSILIISLLMACASNPNTMQKEPLTYLALGDSYTIGESVKESERWPVQLATRLTASGIEVVKPKIIATTGWRTDELKAAIEADNELKESYDMVSLLIGVNNQYQGKSVESFAPEFEELLEMAIKLADNNKDKVFVLSIPDYGKTPFGAEKAEQIAKELGEYNRVSKEICEKYGVAYYNITPISEEAANDSELIADDNLHPSGKMYTQWVDLILDDVKKLARGI